MFFAKVDKNVSFTQKWVKNLVKFPGSEKIFKNILKVLKRMKNCFFAKMGKNVSFTQKWVKNLVKFPGSEKIFKNILKVFKLKFAWVTKPLNFIYPFLRKTHIFYPLILVICSYQVYVF